MKNENYIVISGWMRNELGLKGTELILYAIIYGFCQADEKEQKYTGTSSYLCDWTGMSKQAVLKSLRSLVDKGFIQRLEEDNGYSYIILRPVSKGSTPVSKGSDPVSKSNPINILYSKNKTKKAFISKDINTTTPGTLKKEKGNLYSKCINLIDAFSQDAELRSYLTEFLNILIQDYREEGKQFYSNIFAGKLNNLKTFKPEDHKEIVKRSVLNRWKNFYALDKKGSGGSGFNDDAKSVKYTKEELEELEKVDKERKARGLRTKF